MARGLVSSGKLLAANNGALVTAPCKLWGVNLLSVGAADPKIIITDGSSGTVLYEREIDCDVEGLERLDMFPVGVEAMISIYITISGTNAEAVIYYEAR